MQMKSLAFMFLVICTFTELNFTKITNLVYSGSTL